MTDFRFVQKNLSSTLFPGVPSDVSVHSGFADEHAKTATTILDAVRVLLSLYRASTVVSVSGAQDLIPRSPSLIVSRRSATHLVAPLPNSTPCSSP